VSEDKVSTINTARIAFMASFNSGALFQDYPAPSGRVLTDLYDRRNCDQCCIPGIDPDWPGLIIAMPRQHGHIMPWRCGAVAGLSAIGSSAAAWPVVPPHIMPPP
jgi:hypothetical protein